MTNTIQIYHNPRCSKSRQTLSILEENGVTPEIILYLEESPDAKTISSLLSKLGISARDLLRKGEDAYKELNLKDKVPFVTLLVVVLVFVVITIKPAMILFLIFSTLIC